MGLDVDIKYFNHILQFPLSNHLVSLIPKSKDDNEPLFPTLYVTKTNSVGEIVADERILHYRIGIPRKRFQMILKEADRPKATLHSFRVTFNNLLFAEKLSIEDRQSLMAHSSSKTTTVYTHPNLELARDYINKLPNYSIGKKQNQNVTKT